MPLPLKPFDIFDTMRLVLNESRAQSAELDEE